MRDIEKILGNHKKTEKYLLKKYNIPKSVPVCNIQLLEGKAPVPVVRMRAGKPAYIEILQGKSELEELISSNNEFKHFDTIEEAIKYFLYGRHKITAIRSFNDAKIFVNNFRDYAVPHPTREGHYLFKYFSTEESKAYKLSIKHVVEISDQGEWSCDGLKIDNPVHFVLENRKLINGSLKN
jgi:hypothetical protein